MSRSSVARLSKTARAQDSKSRKEMQSQQTEDSFQNFAASLGLGTRNVSSAGTYGFNPVSRLRTVLEWIHRGSWIGGVAVDVVADDMTRAGADIRGVTNPEDIQHLEQAATTWGVWNAINDTVKWSRLYGGCIAVMLIDGQRFDTPLNINTIGKGQFRGLLVLDRWMIEPSLNDLVRDMGPDLGLPKFYSVTANAPALQRMKIHYSRCLRLEGVRLPFWQRVQENLWGISVYERLYDRMVAFDSATQGAAQLVYKSWIRVMKIKGMRAAIGQGGVAERNLIKMVDFMRLTQSSEGITLLDGEDDFQSQGNPGFAGLSDSLIQFGQQLSGALQIPLVRLFGQSPAGLNSTGESDLRTYYDNINNQQNSRLLTPMTRIYRVMAASEGVKLDVGFTLSFRSLWLMTESEKSQMASQDSSTVSAAFTNGIIRRDTALKELKQSSQLTGRFTNISEEEIAEAEQEPSAFEQQQEAMALEQANADRQMQMEEDTTSPDDDEPKAKGKKKVGDAMLGDRKVFGFNVVIEHERGEDRYGSRLPAPYGYIRQTDSAERGDQMDCFVNNPEEGKIFIIDQYRLDGTFDEHKVMFGYSDSGSALRAWRLYYRRMPEIDLTAIVSGEVSIQELQKFLDHVKNDVSPFNEVNDVNYGPSSNPIESCCGLCKFYLNGACLNREVQFDPRVPEGWGNTKTVEITTWCKEFEKK